jgi:aspartyl/glutamyl-tRNA(Asn/Gln) amidotransferase C subunit
MEIKTGTLITQQELLKLAALSCIKLEPHEVEPLRESLEAVLGYASRLKDVASSLRQGYGGQGELTNIFRPDNAVLCTEPIVECATAHENNYFVVPVIIKQS